jgi:transposase-like protein
MTGSFGIQAATNDRIVLEALAPGANVSAIARQHGLRPQQVFTWRRRAVGRARSENDGAERPSFALVAVDESTEATMSGMSHEGAHMSQEAPMSHMSMPVDSGQAPWPLVPVMALLSFLALAAGAAIALLT